jgi:hypothetical protein
MSIGLSGNVCDSLVDFVLLDIVNHMRLGFTYHCE